MTAKVGHPPVQLFSVLGCREGQLDISDIVRRGCAHVSCQQMAPLTSFAPVINLQAQATHIHNTFYAPCFLVVAGQEICICRPLEHGDN